jgi:signal transduction histidine kinase
MRQAARRAEMGTHGFASCALPEIAPMRNPAAEIPEQQILFSSNLAPGPAQKRLALVLVLCLLIVFFLVLAGLGSVQLSPIAGFVPIFSTATFVIDLITAILLFAQFSILRSRALIVIASGYVYTALIVVPWTLTLPGAFATTSLIGGVQSPAGLFFAWHAGFALFVIAYALSADTRLGGRFGRSGARGAIILSCASMVVVVSALAFVCIVAEARLPRVTLDPLHFGPQWPYLVGAPIVLLSIVALILLWVRRRSMLDLWLMVVMILYAVEIPLTYYPSPFRFSLGWYTVRVIGFCSSILILIVLLYEITTIYARLLHAVLAQRREREARLATGDAVAATIAHEVRQPLTAMIMRAETGFRLLDRPVPDLDKAKAELKNIAADGQRAGAVIGRVRANFKKDARVRTLLDVDELIGETIDLVRGDLQRHRILVEATPHARLPHVIGDRIELQQVLLNLITNSIESMAAQDGRRILRVTSGLRDDGGVMVSVADTGTGIGPKEIDQVFNPLFTTKSGGMGMGLSICRSIIEAHEGELLVTPNTPGGAEFLFVLRPAP